MAHTPLFTKLIERQEVFDTVSIVNIINDERIYMCRKTSIDDNDMMMSKTGLNFTVNQSVYLANCATAQKQDHIQE